MEDTGLYDANYITKLANGDIQTEQERKDIKTIVRWTVEKFIGKLEPKLSEEGIDEITDFQMKRFFGFGLTG